MSVTIYPDYVRYADIAKLYHVSVCTARRWVYEMIGIPKYRTAYLDVSHKVKLIDRLQLEKYLHERNQGKYKRKEVV